MNIARLEYYDAMTAKPDYTTMEGMVRVTGGAGSGSPFALQKDLT
jgi:hypothetical protein